MAISICELKSQDLLYELTLLIGKTGDNGSVLPTWVHLVDTAVSIRYLIKSRIPESARSVFNISNEQLEQLSMFVALVHDIGKLTPLFISKISQCLPGYISFLLENSIQIPEDFPDSGRSPHSVCSESILLEYGVPAGICGIVGGHHGKPWQPSGAMDYIEDQISVYGQNYYGGQSELWKRIQKSWFDFSMDIVGYKSTSDIPCLSFKGQMLLCGLLSEADWIASNQIIFPTIMIDDIDRFKYCENRYRAAFDKLNLPEYWYVNPISDYSVFFKTRFGFEPNSLQKETIRISRGSDSPGIMIIEAQMGLGKTEAALAAAEIIASKTQSGGLFFGLPTQATSNGIFKRLAEWADSASEDGIHTIRLTHSDAELNETYLEYFRNRAIINAEDEKNSNIIAHEWFSGNKKALLADFVVGTVDTALMAVLKQKYVTMRHIGLCGKIVVIDECHAYDAYMNKYLERLLWWLGAYKVPVILLSATLPVNRKESLLKSYLNSVRQCSVEGTSGYPMITWSDNGCAYSNAINTNISDKSVSIIFGITDDIIDTVSEKIRCGGCIGIICNTVKRVQDIAVLLEQSFPEKRIIVFHSRFISEDRRRKENELISILGKNSTEDTRNNVIVVGSQVLEQSLDIDFDFLISEICPMDLLLQRIGRLHRHKRNRSEPMSQAECMVLTGEDVNSGTLRVYDEWIISQTILNLTGVIRIPSDIPGLVNRVYTSCDENDIRYRTWKNKTAIQEANAQAFLLKKPSARINATLHGLLDHEISGDSYGEACVRDSDPSIDVIVMKKAQEDHAAFILNDKLVRIDSVPDEATSMEMARNKLRLPSALCYGENLDKTINALEAENSSVLSQWQESPVISGQLVLLLDEKLQKRISGYDLKYDMRLGLIYERSENNE